ncbi:MAG: hemerythrin domain-containing protein [Euryarchaeota archaeon]|nr:hemerythrin domain-containing protein [Euryarchaeota archaeon]MDE1837880.1 hemerythrin domain-containing protein [Euryarchaeota archaeon]MDE1881649.1 hemerythrin domain-containing protein [Euryarchaeota archaeon]MDE2046226.1 hemerythrin domain-containing protein [Thermoplasmata archaeon]
MSVRSETPADPPLPSPSPAGQLGSFLEEDHDRLDALWVRATLAWPRDQVEARQLFEEFRIGLLRHIRVEEEVLFPFYNARSSPSSRHLTDLLHAEHREIMAALARLMAVVNGGPQDLEEAETVLRNVLWAHNAREEGLLYPWFDPTDDPDLLRLGADVRARLFVSPAGATPPR